MKKHISVILALIMIIGVVAISGCSKGSDGETSAVAEDIPENYEEVSFTNDFYGITFSSALPKFQEFEAVENGDNGYRYSGFTNKESYQKYSVSVYTNVCLESTKETAFNQSSGTVETIELGGQETAKNTRDNNSSGQEIDYDVFIPFLNGYAHADISVSYINDDMTDEQWNELITAFEKYTVVTLNDTNGLKTSSGKLYDSSRILAYPETVKVNGESGTAEQKIGGADIYVKACVDIDSITHEFYSYGDVTDSVFNARKDNTDEYTAVDIGSTTYYCHMINRFPNVECDIYAEIDGVYYNFYINRMHNLDVDSNKEFAADTSNYQLFAQMIDDFISNADRM